MDYETHCLVYIFRFMFKKRVNRHKQTAHEYFARPVVDILAADGVIDATDDSEVNICVPPMCKICNTPIASPHQFHDHMKTHIDKDSYICNICGKHYKMPSMLKVIQ